ncbi:MAG: DUF3450 domain-containing protein [Pseudomonadales bacterium]|nr:DUF3450 domain-containing protein [Pseudomonadales bacterium]
MSYHRFKQKVFVPLLVMPTLFFLTGSASGQDTVVNTQILDRAGEIAEKAFAAAKESQVRINKLSDQADELLGQYRDEAKIVDGLVVYNAGMRRTIAEQEKTIARYDKSITEAAELQRQIPPLMERMMVALEQFVALDLPFQVEARQQRLDLIRGAFDEANVSIAEKFRLVLQAYQIESGYGRTMSSYTDNLEINGVERDVDILQVGRIALIYQTSDQTSTGVWDKNAKQWLALPDSYRRPVANGIRMAKNLASTEILELPIIAPESVQ